MGYIDIFDFSGNVVSRFAYAGPLNAPWGIAVASAGVASQTDGVFGSITASVMTVTTGY